MNKYKVQMRVEYSGSDTVVIEIDADNADEAIYIAEGDIQFDDIDFSEIEWTIYDSQIIDIKTPRCDKTQEMDL